MIRELRAKRRTTLNEDSDGSPRDSFTAKVRRGLLSSSPRRWPLRRVWGSTVRLGQGQSSGVEKEPAAEASQPVGEDGPSPTQWEAPEGWDHCKEATCNSTPPKPASPIYADETDAITCDHLEQEDTPSTIEREAELLAALYIFESIPSFADPDHFAYVEQLMEGLQAESARELEELDRHASADHGGSGVRVSWELERYISEEGALGAVVQYLFPGMSSVEVTKVLDLVSSVDA